MCLDKPKLLIIWNRGSTYCLITRDILYFLPILVCSVNTFLQTFGRPFHAMPICSRVFVSLATPGLQTHGSFWHLRRQNLVICKQSRWRMEKLGAIDWRNDLIEFN
jgi:hypothetical protein